MVGAGRPCGEELRMDIGGYQGLKVWQKAVDLSEEVGRLVDRLPKREQYNLVDQLLRASDSVSSNIAEGNGKRTPKDHLGFLYNAKGSNFEVQSELRLCVRKGYLSEQEIKKAINISISVHKLLAGLIRSVEMEEEKLEEEKRRKQAERRSRQAEKRRDKR